MRTDQRGMTLTEITIVAVIMAILASLAIPNYFKTVEEARSNEAKANLSTIYFAQKIYRENSPGKKYYPETNGTKSTTVAAEFTDMKDKLRVDFPTNFYSIVIGTSDNGVTYTAVATRIGGTKSWTLDYATGAITGAGGY